MMSEEEIKIAVHSLEEKGLVKISYDQYGDERVSITEEGIYVIDEIIKATNG